MKLPTVATVILSAGNSGRLGFHKALLRFGETSALSRVIASALSSKTSLTVVVLGAEVESLRQEIGDAPVTILENRQFIAGRTGSLKCAIRSLDLDSVFSAIMIFPVDCPFVAGTILDQLIECFQGQSLLPTESLWIAPEYAGKRGHPVLLAGPVLFDILALDDDFPLRDFLGRRVREGALRHLTVPVDTEHILDNINTVDDLVYVRQREGLR